MHATFANPRRIAVATRLRRWFGNPINRPQFRRLFLEPLEDRTLPSASIFGSIWHDLIPDGIRGGEPGLAAVTVYLDDGSHTFDGSQVHTQTNGIGAYSLTGLAAGTYSLGVILPSGASLTFPSSASFQTVTVGENDTVTGVDFGVLAEPTDPTNQQITDDPAVQQMPSVAVNPLYPNHVVMAYMDYSQQTNGYARIGISISHDGGANWQQSSVPLPEHYDEAAGNPTVQFDSSGTVFVSFMAATFLGKDSTGSALKPGLIYDTTTQAVNYLNKAVSRRAFGMQANNGVFVARSDNGGLNWQTPVAVSAQRYDQTITTSPAAVATGSATVTPAAMPANLFTGLALIIDEGLPTQERVTVTGFTASTFTATFTKAHAAGFSISVPVFFDAQPDLAIDTNPSSPNVGNLYMTWTRFYPASQFPANTATINATTVTSGSQVLFAASSDGGATWTTRLQNFTSGGKVFQVSTVRDPLTGGTTGATSTEGTGSNTLPRVTVGPEGGVYVSQFAGGRFPVFYSANAGVSFRNPVPVGGPATPMDPGYPFGLDNTQYTNTYPAGASTQSFFQASPLFNNTFRLQSVRAIAADPVRVGTVYAVEAVPVLNTSGVTIDAGEITFSRSTDFGVTWQLMFTVGSSAGNLSELPANLQFRYRSVLNDDNDGRFTGFDSTPQDEVVSGQALPQLSVDEQGNIAVIWYDTRRDPANTRLDVYGTVSTDGGLTFSANKRISSTNFDANGAANSSIGDRIGLALAGGKAYAAWTFVEPGDQDILFSSYDLVAVPFNDRFESNDTPAGATDLGSVTVQRVVPRLSLVADDHDWFKVQPGANGTLIIGASAPTQGEGLRIELWDSAATTRLAVGTAVIENGVVVGVRVDYQASAGETYLVHVLGNGTAEYTLAVQALTKDLGAVVQTAEDATVAAGGSNVYRLVAGVGGTIQVTLTSGADVQGNLNLQVLSADGQTILAQGVEPGTPGPGEVERLRVAVSEGQELLVKVLGTTSASIARVSVSGTPVTLGLGTPGPAVPFTTPAAVGGVRSVALQALGVNPVNVRVVQKNTAGAVLGTQTKLLTPGAPTVVTLANTAGTYEIQALDPVGSGPYHLDIINFDAHQSPGNSSLFFPAGGSSSSIALGDLNGDDLRDLIVTSTQGGDQVRVLLGNADGTFQAPRAFDVGSGQAAISAREPVVGDFTGDGVLDLVVPNFFSADVSLLVGLGDGTFAPQRRFDAVFQANSAVSADFNGDDKLDLAVLDRTVGDAKLAVLLGRGDGTFVPPQSMTIPFVRGDASPVRVGDLNGDDKPDLVVFSASDARFQVLLGNGDGTFALGESFSTGEALFEAQLADLDGDRALDVIIGGGNTGSVIVLRGNGDGTFQGPQSYATAVRLRNDNLGVIGLAVVDAGRADGLGHPDGRLDVVVTIRSRSSGDLPQLFLLAGIAPDANGKLLAPAQKLATLEEAGRIALADFDRDGFQDVAITESGGVRVTYGQPPDIVPNTTKATATNLGTVVHSISPPRAIVSGFEHAYYTLTVPTEAAPGAGDQVLDFSAGFAFVQGAGLQMEVLDSNGNVLGSGERFRVRAAQGQTLLVHIFGRPADGARGPGAGLYNLVIDVLPQVVSVEAQWFVPGVNGQPGGPTTSLVVTFQGDRLDPAAAEDLANYVITWLGGDGLPGTADDRFVTPGTANGTPPVIYNPGTNVNVSAGRTNPTAVRQTVTLSFTEGLEAGSYRIEFKPGLRAAAFNDDEASLLTPRDGFTGHALVSLSAGGVGEGAVVLADDLVLPAGPVGDYGGIKQGSPWLTQLHADLSARLDKDVGALGDHPAITENLLDLVIDRVMPGLRGAGTSFLILVFDPVSIDLADPQGARAQVNLTTNEVSNAQARTFVEAGGNVEVMVLAGVNGTYTVNLSDVQATARAGAVVIENGQADKLVFTDALRDGERTFQISIDSVTVVAAGPGTQSVDGGTTSGDSGPDTPILVNTGGSDAQLTSSAQTASTAEGASLASTAVTGPLVLGTQFVSAPGTASEDDEAIEDEDEKNDMEKRDRKDEGQGDKQEDGKGGRKKKGKADERGARGKKEEKEKDAEDEEGNQEKKEAEEGPPMAPHDEPVDSGPLTLWEDLGRHGAAWLTWQQALPEAAAPADADFLAAPREGLGEAVSPDAVPPSFGPDHDHLALLWLPVVLLSGLHRERNEPALAKVERGISHRTRSRPRA